MRAKISNSSSGDLPRPIALSKLSDTERRLLWYNRGTRPHNMLEVLKDAGYNTGLLSEKNLPLFALHLYALRKAGMKKKDDHKNSVTFIETKKDRNTLPEKAPVIELNFRKEEGEEGINPAATSANDFRLKVAQVLYNNRFPIPNWLKKYEYTLGNVDLDQRGNLSRRIKFTGISGIGKTILRIDTKGRLYGEEKSGGGGIVGGHHYKIKEGKLIER